MDALQTDASIWAKAFRVFPLSNWTEMDMWRYYPPERNAIPTLYFSRPVLRDGMWLAISEVITPLPHEQ